jgi:hypothetical protein
MRGWVAGTARQIKSNTAVENLFGNHQRDGRAEFLAIAISPGTLGRISAFVALSADGIIAMATHGRALGLNARISKNKS